MHVTFDCMLGNKQAIRDIRIGQSLIGKKKHVAFPLSQAVLFRYQINKIFFCKRGLGFMILFEKSGEKSFLYI